MCYQPDLSFLCRHKKWKCMLYRSFWYIYISLRSILREKKLIFVAYIVQTTETTMTLHTNTHCHVTQIVYSIQYWLTYLYWASLMILCMLSLSVLNPFCCDLYFYQIPTHAIIVINYYSSTKYLSLGTIHAYNESSSTRNTIITSKTTTTQLPSVT